MQDVRNKVAYITGGSKGIGFGVAQKLIAAGMKVAISGRTLKTVEKAAEYLGDESNVLALSSDVTEHDDEKKAELLQNAGIIRNKLKVNATITNAQLFMKIQEEFGSFSKYLWAFVNEKPIKNKFENYKEDSKWIYGPGVCDMKGGNIVALQSLRNIYNENKSISNIDFLLVSDEESGSDDSKHVTLDIAKN